MEIQLVECICSQTKWPEQSEELLGLIVNSLSTLDSAVPQGCPEPRRRPQSVHKIALVLEKAPRHLQPDLISLVPKLVDSSEHSLAATILIDCLENQDKESVPWLPVFLKFFHFTNMSKNTYTFVPQWGKNSGVWGY